MTEHIWKRARKKAVVVEFREVEPKESFGGYGMTSPLKKGEHVQTLNGNVLAIAGEDYIVRGVDGELYPVNKQIFAKTYDVLGSESLGKRSLFCDRVICLVGSTKIGWKARYREVLEKLTMMGNVVLTVVWFRDELANFESHRGLLEKVHFHKIRVSDFVVCIHRKAIGEHTQLEIEYALSLGKQVYFAEDIIK